MAACRNSELTTMSVKKQLQVMGAARADDLISTMITDHEQARTRGTPATPAAVPPSGHAPVRSQSVPDAERPQTSLVSRLWRSKTVTEEMVLPTVALAIRQSHWMPADKASKCAGPTCRILFTSSRIKRRNCAMCGNVFCRTCTNYSRRLSSNALPDTLGLFHSVCQACFNHHTEFGAVRDHMREFSTIRQHRRNLMQRNEEEQGRFSICSRRSTDGKKAAVRKEVRRLVNGYKANPGKLKDLVSEVKVPDWQKSSNWVVSKNALACMNCGGNFGVMKRKLHCRIGGQVFCSNCGAEELILYVDEDGDVQWALNGKDGGPTTVPTKYRLLFICQNCSSELQDILVEGVSTPPPSVFLNSLFTLHEQLSILQAKIESNLPTYKQLVESMEAADCTPKRVEAKNPMQRLIKVQLDLSDAFSTMAVESQRLKTLKPTNHVQEKLLRNIMMGMYRTYSDNMYSFRNLKNHLAEFVPMETMGMIQASLSQQSLERVHVLVQQLTLEALNLEQQWKLESSFLAPIITISTHMDAEFKDFIEQRGESWEAHGKAVLKFIEEELKNHRRRIKINSAVLSQCRQPSVIQYLVVSQCSSLIHECYRELQAKTIDREFRMVKESLHEACEKLDIILTELNAIMECGVN